MLLLPIGLMASAPVVPAGLLLDSIAATVVGAYGLRKLRGAYAGSAIQVRRSSDSTTQDVGFASGGLDTAALLAFCGSASGFVSKWYDQSGGGQDVIQPTTANQPQIVSAGAVIAMPNATAKPGLQLIAASSTSLTCASFPLTGATAYACIGVASRTASGSASYARLALFDGSGADYTTPNAIFIYQNSGSTVTAYHGGDLSQCPLGTAAAQIASVFNGSTHLMTVDGTAGSAAAVSDTLPSGGALVFGMGASNGTALGSPWDGAMGEHIVISGALSSADQATIRASQQAYYGTP